MCADDPRGVEAKLSLSGPTVFVPDTLRWLLSAAPDEPLPDLLVNPPRPGRHEPRVIKDLRDTYRKITRPRNQLRKELKKQALNT